MGKKKPAKEATLEFVNNVRTRIQPSYLRERESDDVQNHPFSHSEWQKASESTRKLLNNKIKEPQNLLFFCGAIYECTYNNDMRFSQSQICMLLELPSQADLDQFHKIEVIIAPPGIQDVIYDCNKSKSDYINEGWKLEKIGVAPSRIIKISKNIQAERRQYGLKHRITSTIHGSMGDTLTKVATEISHDNNSFRLWDKAQVIVACSQTKLGKNTIFVGDKRSIIQALTYLIQRKN